ncbi:MAG: transcriptional regulator [Gammaproteobacteria bacterium]|nr:transcriptional regulator [Gammaproteobacteria bacterium]
MTERIIAAEVLDGLREIREHRAGRRTLRTVHVEARPLPLTPEAIRDIRNHLDVSRAVFAHMIRVPVRTVERWEQGRSSPPELIAALFSWHESTPTHSSVWPPCSCAVFR